MQAVTTYIRFTTPQGNICLDSSDRLTLAPFESNSWSGIRIPDEIVSEIKRVRPESFKQTGSAPPFSPEDSLAVTQTLDIDWIRRKLHTRADVSLPATAQLARIRLAEDVPPPGSDQTLELIELITFVRRRGWNLADITLFQLLALIYNASLVHSSEARSKFGLGPRVDDWKVNLAQGLLALKVSPDSDERTRYSRIQRTFKMLTQLSVEAVQGSELVGSSEGVASDSQSRPVALVLFSQDGFSYPA